LAFVEEKDLSPLAQAWVRFVHSRVCLCLYVTLLVFNLCVLILEIVGTTLFDRIFVMVCEGFINAFLTVEVVMGLIIFRLVYLKKWYHVVDCILTVLCWVFYFMFLKEETPTKTGMIDLSVDSVLLGFRYAFQTLRFIFVFLHSRRKTRIVNVEDIKFPPAGSEVEVTAHQPEEEHVDAHSTHANLFSKVHAVKLFAADFFAAHSTNNVPEQKDPKS